MLAVQGLRPCRQTAQVEDAALGVQHQGGDLQGLEAGRQFLDFGGGILAAEAENGRKSSAGALASAGNRRRRRFYLFILRGDLQVVTVRSE